MGMSVLSLEMDLRHFDYTSLIILLQEKEEPRAFTLKRDNGQSTGLVSLGGYICINIKIYISCKNVKDYLIMFIVQKCPLYRRLYMLAICETKEAKNSQDYQSNSSAGTCYLGC